MKKKLWLAASFLAGFAVHGRASTDTVKPSLLPANPQTQVIHRNDNTVVEILKFKTPSTAHGQILSPGQKPPATTLAESERLDVLASTPVPVSSGTYSPHP